MKHFPTRHKGAKAQRHKGDCGIGYFEGELLIDQMSGEVLMIKTYRDLIVWQKSTAMVTDFYRVTRDFPQDELFEKLTEKTQEIERMLGSLIRKVEKNKKPQCLNSLCLCAFFLMSFRNKIDHLQVPYT